MAGFAPPSEIARADSTRLNKMRTKDVVPDHQPMNRFVQTCLVMPALLLPGLPSVFAETPPNQRVVTATVEPAPTPAPAPKADQTALVRLLNDSFVGVFEKVAPSVVVISVTKKMEGEEGEGGDYFQDFFFPGGQHAPRPVQSEGSGFIARPDGYIYTNNHVVEDAETIKVRLKDGREFDGKLIGSDDRTDVAVIKIEAKELPVAELGNSEAVRVGQLACAIGAPYNLDYTFTVGWVSGKGRTNLQNSDQHVMYEEYIQTDASINPGNSGGPLLDLEGKVIGMNTLINGINRGLGFAIPVNMVDDVGKELINKGRVTRPWLGIRIESLSDSRDLKDSPAYKGLDKGVVVVTIEPDTPAFGTDLRPADVITEVDGEAVKTDRDLQKKILSKKVGQNVLLTVRRRDQTLRIPVVTGELPNEFTRVSRNTPPKKTDESQPQQNDLGLQVQDLSPELGTRLGIQGGGVVVTDVTEGSAAALAKIAREDVISEVDGKPVTSVAEFDAAIKNRDKKRGSLLFINRKGEKTFAVLKTEEQ